MGLAASQSRLLMLTMRKNDVESGLMSIANDKLALSRQSAQLSQNYSNALNATKLAWDLGDSTTDLTYALIMTPNATETSNQYLLTNNYGAVILDSAYAQKLGLGDSGSGDNFRSQYPNAIGFVQKFGISDATAQKALNAVNNGNTNTNALKLTTVGTQISNLGTAIGDWYNGSSRYIDLGSHKVGWSIQDDEVGNNSWYVDGSWQTEISMIKDANDNDDDMFGNTNADWGWYHNWGQSDVKSRAESLLKGRIASTTVDGDVNSITNTLGTALQTSIQSDLASQISSNSVISTYMTEIKAAIAYAKATTEMVVVYNVAPPTDAKDKKPPTGGNANGFKSSNTYLSISYDVSKQSDDYGNSIDMRSGTAKYTMDNAKIINTFMYYFDMYVADNINNTVDASGVNTRAAGFNPGGAAPQDYGNWNAATRATTIPQTLVNTAIPTTGDDLNINDISDYYEAVYYVNLYNALVQKGWAVDSNIDNKNYLEKQVLYGNVNLEKLTSSAPSTWETVSTGDYDSPITSEADSTAVTKAEAEYTAAKNKLDYKESQLDIQSNTLDTERSAVTTEIDSVNAIIKKNLDVFKVFESNG